MAAKKAAPKKAKKSKRPTIKGIEVLRGERDLFKHMYLNQADEMARAREELIGYKDALSRGSRGLKDQNEALRTQVAELQSENGRLRANVRYFDESVHQIRQRVFDYLDIEDAIASKKKAMTKSDYEELRPKREVLRAWLKAQWELDNA